MEGFGDATLSRTRSARLSEYRRKYSDALAASSPPSGASPLSFMPQLDGPFLHSSPSPPFQATCLWPQPPAIQQNAPTSFYPHINP